MPISRWCSLALGGIALTLFPQQSQAQLVVLDFEGLDAMTFISRNPIPLNARLSDRFLPAYGVRFSSESSYVAVVALGAGHATSGVNGIGGATLKGALTYDHGVPIVARFFDPASPSHRAVTDFVSVRADNAGSGLPITLDAFDVDGHLIATQTVADLGGATLTVSAPGIHSVEYRGTVDDAGAALDDFSFHPVTPVDGDHVGGYATGVGNARVVCLNVTTGQSVTLFNQSAPWDCETAGLIVRSGDVIRQTITATAH